VTKIYYLEFVRASEGRLAVGPGCIFSKRVDVRQAVVKIIAESLPQHNGKHVVQTPLSRIRVGKRRSLKVY
jgi:hypothetical protein